jgi:hypothetical protein
MGFINFNKRISKAIASFFPNTKFKIYDYYLEIVIKKLKDNQTTLDVGGVNVVSTLLQGADLRAIG